MIGWIYSLTHDPITRYTVKNITSDNKMVNARKVVE